MVLSRNWENNRVSSSVTLWNIIPRALSFWRSTQRYRAKLGLRHGIWYGWQLRAMWRAPAGSLHAVHIPKHPHPIWLRAGSSDPWVFEQLFLHEELLFELKNSPTWIIDAGANIGLASIYLALRYPQARIIAMELEATNFAMLKKNTAWCPRIHPMHAGLWSRKAELCVANPDADAWSFQATALPDQQNVDQQNADLRIVDQQNADQQNVDQRNRDGSAQPSANDSQARNATPLTPDRSPEEDYSSASAPRPHDARPSFVTIPALGVADVLETYGIEKLDLLKIDVEGAEAEIFRAGTEVWIDRVQTIAIELHERYRPGCTAIFEQALASRRFTWEKCGEYDLVHRDEPTPL